MMIRSLLRLPILLTIASGGLLSQTIVQNTGGTFLSSAGYYFGQAFTTPNGGPWVMTSFNYFSDVPAVTPAAAGKLYVFSAPYTGTPAGLNASLPNLIGVSSRVSGGIFVFDTAVVLNPRTTYHVFSDTSFIISGNNAGNLGAFYYFAASSTSPFGAYPSAQTNYRVSGGLVGAAVPIGTPAVTGLALLLAACASLLMRRQQRASASWR